VPAEPERYERRLLQAEDFCRRDILLHRYGSPAAAGTVRRPAGRLLALLSPRARKSARALATIMKARATKERASDRR
jgi:hypothetical protein